MQIKSAEILCTVDLKQQRYNTCQPHCLTCKLSVDVVSHFLISYHFLHPTGESIIIQSVLMEIQSNNVCAMLKLAGLEKKYSTLISVAQGL